MKYLRKFILFIFLLVFSISFTSCQPPNKTDDQEGFEKFTDELFLKEVQRDTITLNFSLDHWKDYGFTQEEITFGHFSPSYIENVLASYENYLTSLNTFNYDELTKSQQLTYDILKYSFELELSQYGLILYHEVLGPTTGIQAQLPILLAEFDINTKDDLEIYLKLVESVNKYMKEICEFQKLKSESGLFMREDTANEIIKQCLEFIQKPESNFLISTVNSKINNLGDLSEEEKTSYQSLNQDVIINSLIPSYELLIATLQELKSTGNNDKGLCYYEKGSEFYEYLIACNTSSSKTIPQMIEMIDLSIEENISTMGEILSDDPSVYDQVLTFTFPLTEPEQIITYLQEAILADFPSIPHVNCLVSYVPESLQEHISPAMYIVPPIDNYENNIIYINSYYDLSNIFPTMAHEGYPGHLYQSVYFRNSQTSPIRSLLNFGGYIEGWATYVEYYSYYLAGLDENVADFIVANMATNMGVYCRLDMGIHYEGWTMSNTYSYLNSIGINDIELCSLLFATILEEPALYPQYGIGYLELLELKNMAQEKLGNSFVLKDFHTFILDMGPASFSIIMDRMDQELERLIK